MLSSEAQNRIKQLNPWMIHPEKAEELISHFLPKEYVTRDIEQTPLQKDRAMLVIGPRQSGKSTLVWYILCEFTPDIFFLNMEDPLLRAEVVSPFDFVEHMRGNYPFIKAIFIDEIQHMEEAGLFVKGLVDARVGMLYLGYGHPPFTLEAGQENPWQEGP